MAPIKIATYNVNGFNGRLPILLDWLAEAAPDIICLQELKAAHDRFAIDAIRAAGYGAIWYGQRSWNGVAILAKGVDPIETRRGLPGDPEPSQSRSRRPSKASSSAASICPTAIPRRNPNSPTSSLGPRR